MSAHHISTVIWAGVRAADDRAPGFEEIGRMIIARGLKAFVEPVVRFLAPAITGEPAMGEPVAAGGPQGGARKNPAKTK